ncbi:TonB-dependent receptor [Marinomonas sp. 15G1-11]|uniref:TonB-dependent receptor n=1 Tax=Marinomonas phaeophyticola TaxID=3004091 RepID=A0ABT4JWU4_9GAMM|nr:TonB-dependent receptor [Marinomonas sp. 15G1-11]MCZ2722847.1 TonB-dependent receptor [Marinomonas sp. 15G1-11]
MKKNNTLVLVCVLGLGYSDLHAQDNQVAIGVFGEELNQVVTPSKIYQSRKEISSSVSVLDRSFIQRSGARSVEELMQFVPGFFVAPYRDSGEVVVAYHGTQLDKYRRIQVLVNGRSVYSSGLARVEWASLPLSIEDVERVEVNRGPNAASYGANSFFAVINIITRAPQDTLGGTVSAYIDKRGDNSLYAQYSDLSGPWSYRASIASKNVDGFDVDASNTDRHDGYDTQIANVYILHEQHNQQFEIDFGEAHSTTKKELEESAFESKPPSEDVERGYFKVDWTKQLSLKHEISMHYYYEKSDSMEKRFVSIPNTITKIDIRGDTYQVNPYEIIFNTRSSEAVVSSAYYNDLVETRQDIELQSRLELYDNIKIVTAFNYRYDKVDSQSYFQGKQSDELGRISSNLEYTLSDSWIINTGGMLESSKIDDMYFSPKFGITKLLNANQSVRVNASRAIRTPDIFDQYARWNIHLISGEQSGVTYAQDGESEETITSYEVGYFHSIPQYGITYDLRVFQDRMKDLVISNKGFGGIGDSVIEEGDIVDLVIEGVEFEADWRSQDDILARLTYAYQDTQTDEQKLIDTTSPLSLSLLVSAPISSRMRLNGRYLYAKELGSYDYKNINLWISGDFPLSYYKSISFGVGVEKRLDDNPFLVKNNLYLNDQFYYGFASFKF